MTPEARALLVGLTFPISNTNGEAEAMGRMIAEQIRAAVAEEREACAALCDEFDGPFYAAQIRARGL